MSNNFNFNATITNNTNNKEENTMKNVTNFTDKDIQNYIELAQEFKLNGGGFDAPAINGKLLGYNTEMQEGQMPLVMGGWNDEADRQAYLKFMEKLSKASGYDSMKAMENLMGMMTVLTEGYGEVTNLTDENIEVNGMTYIISYKTRKLFNQYGQEVANLNGFEDDDLTKKLIKKMLLDKIQ